MVFEARKLAWEKITAYGLEIEAQNINGGSSAKVWDGRPKTTEEKLLSRVKIEDESELVHEEPKIEEVKTQPAP